MSTKIITLIIVLLLTGLAIYRLSWLILPKGPVKSSEESPKKETKKPHKEPDTSTLIEDDDEFIEVTTLLGDNERKKEKSEVFFDSNKVIEGEVIEEVKEGTGILTFEERTDLLSKVQKSKEDHPEENEIGTGILFSYKEATIDDYETALLVPDDQDPDDIETGLLTEKKKDEPEEITDVLNETPVLSKEIEIISDPEIKIMTSERETTSKNTNETVPEDSLVIINQKLSNVKYQEKDLKGLLIKDSLLEECNFLGSELDNSVFINTEFINCNFKFSCIENASLKNVKFTSSLLNKAALDNSVLDKVEFTDSNLKDISFKNAVLRNVKFDKENSLELKEAKVIEGE